MSADQQITMKNTKAEMLETLGTVLVRADDKIAYLERELATKTAESASGVKIIGGSGE